MHSPAFLPASVSTTATVRPTPNAPRGTMATTLKMLERCSYRAMTSDEDLDFLSRWRWQNYMDQETITNRSMKAADFEDGKDRLPTARTVGLYLDDALIASMRIHAINREAYNLCVVDVGRDRIEREVADGNRFVFSSRWVSDPRHSCNVPMIIATTRIAPMAAEYHDADYAISVSRENHVKMYRRMQNAVLWTDAPGTIDNLDYNYHLVASDYHEFRDRMTVDRQPYLSCASERSAIFSPLADSKRLVKPTASAVLAGRRSFI